NGKPIRAEMFRFQITPGGIRFGPCAGIHKRQEESVIRFIQGEAHWLPIHLKGKLAVALEIFHAAGVGLHLNGFRVGEAFNFYHQLEGGVVVVRAQCGELCLLFRRQRRLWMLSEKVVLLATYRQQGVCGHGIVLSVQSSLKHQSQLDYWSPLEAKRYYRQKISADFRLLVSRTASSLRR